MNSTFFALALFFTSLAIHAQTLPDQPIEIGPIVITTPDQTATPEPTLIPTPSESATPTPVPVVTPPTETNTPVPVVTPIVTPTPIVVPPDQFTAVRASCIKCHTATTTNFPRIDGQNEEYLFQTLKDYSAKVRHSPMAIGMMNSKVKSLDEDMFKALSTYFTSLPVTNSIAGDAALIAKGEELYLNPLPGTTFKSCAECHGLNAEGKGNNDPLNPRLAGQIKNFLKAQFTNYKTGLINNQTDMQAISAALTDEQIAALIEYLASK